MPYRGANPLMSLSDCTSITAGKIPPPQNRFLYRLMVPRSSAEASRLMISRVNGPWNLPYFFPVSSRSPQQYFPFTYSTRARRRSEVEFFGAQVYQFLYSYGTQSVVRLAMIVMLLVTLGILIRKGRIRCKSYRT